MKSIWVILLATFSISTQAATCEVSVESDVSTNNGWFLFHLEDGSRVEVGEDDQVLLDGETLPLTPEQEKAVKQYRQSVSSHFDKLAEYAKSNAKFLDTLIDDVAVSLGSPDAFDELKSHLDSFWDKVSKSYSENGDVILPSGSFDELKSRWTEHSAQAKALFDEQFLDQVWELLSAKVKTEDGFNLTSLGEAFVELQAKVSERLQDHSDEVEKSEEDMCDSLHDIVEQESNLRQQIPELHSYRVFTI